MSALRKVVQWARTPEGRRVIMTVADAAWTLLSENDTDEEDDK